MTKAKISTMTIDELADKFAEISIATGRGAVLEEIGRFNRLYRQMDRVGHELKRRNGDARIALKRLYGHPNAHVRLNAAKETLAVAPAEARRALQALAASSDYPQSADAGLALDFLKDGTYRPT